MLEIQPDSTEALIFLANAAQERGDGETAVRLLSQASKADPANVDILMHLGAAYRTAERFDASRYVLERAVRLTAGRNAHARLSLANLLELDDRPELALLHYCRALIEARRLGQWASHDEKVGDLSPALAHAKRYVAAGRRDWLERALRESGNEVAEGLTRISAALASYLNARPPQLYPSQRAGVMHLPDVASARFIDSARLDWLDRLPKAIASCLEEMKQCVASSISSGQAPAGARAIRVPLYKAGVLQYGARQFAPTLLSALRELPLAEVRHHAPDVDIVALNGGARLARHYGNTNAFCQIIVNPAGSAALQVTVGGENRVLHPATALAADPSFGVEYVTVGEARVLALVVAAWHPEIGDCERRAFSRLLTALVDFDHRVQELD